MNVAYNVDCMNGMREYPDKHFDLAVVDPPYGIGCMSMTYTKEGKHREKYGTQAAMKRDYSKQSEWDLRPSTEYFQELFRISKAQIVWGGNYFSDILPPSKGFIVWDKRVSDSMRNDFADCEYAWLSPGLGVARVFRFVWNGMIQGNMKNKEDRFHPTQKPIELYSWIFRNYAKPGDKILDTHLGSGSSRIAAYDAGFDFVGYEIDKEYFDKQEERFLKHTEQLNLFLKNYGQEEQQKL